ncbi:uncharacterized protein BDR25DRAFT_358104 [Lindgomyces ingoldianus]|uniref:Uncharacterized protein n=1 Tax=Lindgomyces ingoldianus TaxID=673940 RepID=A0ACB6QNH0_9PLEO|nr:uncharacterized protein BDR25DRAFT_358104 [Lindgomyces ingoldianus]KAF2467832.1 hypothetical protein BDR25DRAFT_358104 [Lindgomyces ingoldianus]
MCQPMTMLELPFGDELVTTYFNLNSSFASPNNLRNFRTNRADTRPYFHTSPTSFHGYLGGLKGVRPLLHLCPLKLSVSTHVVMAKGWDCHLQTELIFTGVTLPTSKPRSVYHDRNIDVVVVAALWLNQPMHLASCCRFRGISTQASRSTGTFAFHHRENVMDRVVFSPPSPLPIPRGLTSPGTVDPGVDAWAEALSGVGPLILLVGERNTKQLLRDMRGAHSILSLAFAPLGLLSVLTSMIRLCGAHALRSFLGYQHEARTAAAMEVTRVNCGSVHAEMVDGSIVRSTVPNPPSQALAVVSLSGCSEIAVVECMEQIRHCETFQSRLQMKGAPQGAADINWCFRISSQVGNEESAQAIMSIISEVLDVGDGCCQLHRNSQPLVQAKSSSRPMPSRHGSSGWSFYSSLTGSTLLSRQSSSAKKLDESPPFTLPRPLNVSFLSTFTGISEFSAGPPTPKFWSFFIACMSLISMLAVQILSFWNKGWTSAAPVMVIAGYIGLFAGVSAAAWLIYDSQDSANLAVRAYRRGAEWKTGVIVAIKKPDSMDTSGTPLQRNKSKAMNFEAVWLKSPSRQRLVLSWIVTLFLTLSFVCHYLGLRSSKWWLAIAELLICLTAAFARTMIKSEPSRDKFKQDGEVFVDKRCYSTGVLDSGRPMRIEKESRSGNLLDLRMYSLQRTECTPAKSELIAWQAAKLLTEKPDIASYVLQLTDMSVTICKGDVPTERKVIIAFSGGVLTEEGLAFPNAQMCLAFPTQVSDLAAPTPLLVRGLMRQPEWSIDHQHLAKKNLPWLGGMYITTMDSMLSWWILSEDRNDMSDQHSNLHGSMLLVSLAFFVAVLKDYGTDVELVKGIEKSNKGSSKEEHDIASHLVSFLVAFVIYDAVDIRKTEHDISPCVDQEQPKKNDMQTFRKKFIRLIEVNRKFLSIRIQLRAMFGEMPCKLSLNTIKRVSSSSTAHYHEFTYREPSQTPSIWHGCWILNSFGLIYSAFARVDGKVILRRHEELDCTSRWCSWESSATANRNISREAFITITAASEKNAIADDKSEHAGLSLVIICSPRPVWTSWTFQEGYLPGRSLIFTQEQVFWVCDGAFFCENSHLELPYVYEKGQFDTPLRAELIDGPLAQITTNRHTFRKMYQGAVSQYTRRHLTCPEDIHDALQAVLEAFERIFGEKLHWGHPRSRFGLSLFWSGQITMTNTLYRYTAKTIKSTYRAEIRPHDILFIHPNFDSETCEIMCSERQSDPIRIMPIVGSNRFDFNESSKKWSYPGHLARELQGPCFFGRCPEASTRPGFTSSIVEIPTSSKTEEVNIIK